MSKELFSDTFSFLTFNSLNEQRGRHAIQHRTSKILMVRNTRSDGIYVSNGTHSNASLYDLQYGMLNLSNIVSGTQNSVLYHHLKTNSEFHRYIRSSISSV